MISRLQLEDYLHAFVLAIALVAMPSLSLAQSPASTNAAANGVDLTQHGVSGAWYNPASSGQGFLFSVMPNVDGAGHAGYFGGWFTYVGITASTGQWRPSQWYSQALGSPVWLTLQGTTAAPLWHGQLFLDVYDNDGRDGTFDAPPAVPAAALGQALITLSDCNHMHISVNVEHRENPIDPTWQEMNLVRLMPNVNCSESQVPPTPAPSAFGYSGAWYDPATSGQGFAFEVNPAIGPNVATGGGSIFGGWFTYARASVPEGNKGRRWYTLQGGYDWRAAGSDTGNRVAGNLDVYETTGGTFATPNTPTTVITRTKVGSASVTFDSCTAATVIYQFYGGENAGLSNTIRLQRLGSVPADCIQ